MINSVKAASASAHLQSIQYEEKTVSIRSESLVQFTNTTDQDDLFHRGLKILKASIDFETSAKVPEEEELYAKLKTYGSFEELKENEYTPEKVSGRILDFIKGNFALFQKQNPDMTETEAIQKYSEVMKDAVNSGYEKALAVLGDLPQEVADELQASIDLVHEGIQEFKESHTGIN